MITQPGAWSSPLAREIKLHHSPTCYCHRWCPKPCQLVKRSWCEAGADGVPLHSGLMQVLGSRATAGETVLQAQRLITCRINGLAHWRVRSFYPISQPATPVCSPVSLLCTWCSEGNTGASEWWRANGLVQHFPLLFIILFIILVVVLYYSHPLVAHNAMRSSPFSLLIILACNF